MKHIPMREVKRVEWEVDDEFAAEVRIIYTHITILECYTYLMPDIISLHS
jgi:Arc/MetJ family transcription regulator